MHIVKVIFESGNTLITRVNGTKQQIRQYYEIGSIVGFDNIDRIVNVEFIA